MALFKTVLRTEDLPPIGAGREALALDFKGDRYDTRMTFEMAKDVAAFANATGGVILVGAEEDQSHHVLAAYKPIATEADAAAQREAINLAVRDRCMPPPLIDPSVIEYPGGGFVVAVNVWPYPAQPVAVKVRADKGGEGFGGPCYVFPARIGVHTQFLRPEQLPMLMIPQLRATAIRLDAIQRGEPIRVVDARGMMPGGDRGDMCFFRCVDPLACCFTIEYSKNPIELPLDVVRSIWRRDGIWIVAIEGRWGSDTKYHRTDTIPGQP